MRRGQRKKESEKRVGEGNKEKVCWLCDNPVGNSIGNFVGLRENNAVNIDILYPVSF
jgi:hypothetical protein